MIDIFKIIFCTCGLSLGAIVSVQPGMIFEQIGYWANRKSEKNKLFELFICPWCASSFWSIIGYGVCFLSGVVKFDYHFLFLWPVVIGSCSIIVGMIWTAYQFISEKIVEIKDKRDG